MPELSLPAELFEMFFGADEKRVFSDERDMEKMLGVAKKCIHNTADIRERRGEKKGVGKRRKRKMNKGKEKMKRKRKNQ